MSTNIDKKNWIGIVLLCAASLLTACGGSNESDSANTKFLASGSQSSAANFNNINLGDLGFLGDAKSLTSIVADAGFFPNDHGVMRTYSTAGHIDTNNPFFKPFGNGRSCASCHTQAEGFSITPQGLQARFVKSQGTDPIFMLNDGANSPNAPVATLQQKRAAYSMLLNKGLIRVGMKVPATAEFELVSADDPYHYAGPNELSLFRRPLPSANLKFTSNIMWDGRETLLDPASTNCLFGFLCFASLDVNLASQANNATIGHAQAAAGLTAAQQTAIVNFEKTLLSAQVYDWNANFLNAASAKGGPNELINTDFYIGINDQFFGNVRTGAPFDLNAMKVYGGWEDKGGARAAIARGEKLFNTKTFALSGVGGINDDLGIPVLPNATCTTCHNAPQAGSNSMPFPENIGVSDALRRTLEMPLYTLRNKTTGATIQTTDPGAAMITGNWRDIGRFKTPNLRGLAAHPPYFHDGSAATIKDTVLFYNTRFAIGYTAQEISDLTAFLAAL